MIRTPFMFVIALSLIPLSSIAATQQQATLDQTAPSAGPVEVPQSKDNDVPDYIQRPVSVINSNKESFLKNYAPAYKPKVYVTDPKTGKKVQKELTEADSYLGQENTATVPSTYKKSNAALMKDGSIGRSEPSANPYKNLNNPALINDSKLGQKDIGLNPYSGSNPALITDRTAENESAIEAINSINAKYKQERLAQIETLKTAPSPVDNYLSDLFNVPVIKNTADRYEIGFSGSSFYRHDSQTEKTVFRDFNLKYSEGKFISGSIAGFTKDYIYFKTSHSLIQIDAKNTNRQKELPMKIEGFSIFGSKPIAVVSGVGLITFENEEQLENPSLQSVQHLGDNKFLENGVQAYEEDVENSAGVVTHSIKGLVAFTESGVYRVDLNSGKTYSYGHEAFVSQNKINKIVGIKDDTLVFYQDKTYSMGKPELRVVRMTSGDQSGKSRLIPNEVGVTGFTRAGNLIYLFKVGQIEVYDLSKQNAFENPLKVKTIPANFNGVPLEIASGKILGKTLITFNKDGLRLERFPLSGNILSIKTLIQSCKSSFARLGDHVNAPQSKNGNGQGQFEQMQQHYYDRLNTGQPF